MGLFTEEKNYVLGRGDIFFAARKADGTLAGERPLGNTPSFKLAANSTSVKHYSSARGMKVQDRDVPVQTDYSSTVQSDDVSTENLSVLFLGSASAVAVTSATAINETIDAISLGLSYQIGMDAGNPSGLRNIANVVVKKGVTVLVANTDYTVDLAQGRVTILDTGIVLVEGDNITVTYDRTAYTQNRVLSGADVIAGALRFIAYNAEGENKNYYLPDVKLSPNGDFELKADTNWQMMTFNLSVNTPANGSAIYVDGAPLA